jgi:hypothetical protein
MLADKTILTPANVEAVRKNAQALQRPTPRDSGLSSSLGVKKEDARTPLLEYAVFLLDQEARYCQQ